MEGSYWVRNDPWKDYSNGVIGQAWVIEALLAAYQRYDWGDALKAALDLFERHPFDEKMSAWHRVSVDGSYLSVDRTFNHQLWFAAVSAELPLPNAKIRALNFLENVVPGVRLYRDGVIFHNSPLRRLPLSAAVKDNSIVSNIRADASRIINWRTLHIKSVGYHAFNLYALAILKRQFPDHYVWRHKKIEKAIRAPFSKQFFDLLSREEYGWKYNPAGFELAYVGEVFELGTKFIKQALNYQHQMTFDEQSKSYNRNTADPRTSAARLYEVTRLESDHVMAELQPWPTLCYR